MKTTINQNVSSGKWAVAIVGMKGWCRESAIGDGITTARMALVTRCETREEAEALAAEWNAAQPRVTPGGNDVFVYEATKYAARDYISRQALDNGVRACDRRIASMPR